MESLVGSDSEERCSLGRLRAQTKGPKPDLWMDSALAPLGLSHGENLF